MASDPSIKIPQLFILKNFGDTLVTQLDTGKKVQIAFKRDEMQAPSPTAGQMSDFTSWGVTPNLDFKPEITAPGGNILSTLNDNSYGMMSGTSMAAPYVAGGSTLVEERVDKDFGVAGLARTKMTKNILMNTSRPQEDISSLSKQLGIEGIPYSPRRQGAGLMDLYAAMQTSADKVIKHLENFKILLDHQKDNRLISDEAYHALKNAADTLEKKWRW
jgi:lactocepin